MFFNKLYRILLYILDTSTEELNMEKNTKKSKDIRFEKEAKALKRNLEKRKIQEKELKQIKENKKS